MPSALDAELAALPDRVSTTACRAEWAAVYDHYLADVPAWQRALQVANPLLRGLVETAEEEAGWEWPANPEATRTLLLLCRKGRDGFPLAELLPLGLEEWTVDMQDWLRRLAPGVVEEVIRFAAEFAPHLEEQERTCAYQLLIHAPLEADVPPAGLADHAAEFAGRHQRALDNIIFNADWQLEPLGLIIDRPHQRAFDFFHRFRSRRVDGLAEDDPFFAVEFGEMIRFAPLYTWLNGALLGQGGVGDIRLGDANWRHLATGGSWRKLPDGRPVSRGMAKLLNKIYYVEHFWGMEDHYLTAYAANLGADPVLAAAASRFLRRHPEDPAAQAAEFKRWEDVLQVVERLRAEVEGLNERVEFVHQAAEYLALLLRDQPEKSITGYTVDQLREEIEAFNARREARLAARRRAKEKSAPEAKVVYRPLPRFQQVEGKDPKGNPTEFVQLRSRYDLEREGNLMGHCVGGEDYHSRCSAGHAFIFSLRAYERARKRWRSVVTLYVGRDYRSPKKYVLGEIRGRFNADPPDWTVALIEKWAAGCGLVRRNDMY